MTKRPRPRNAFLLALLALASIEARAEVVHEFENGTVVELLSARESARAILQDAPAPFFDRLTLLEISIRRGEDVTSRDVDAERERFRRYVAESVADWTEPERQALLSRLRLVYEELQRSELDLLPPRWRFIKTNGREEGGAAYTRGASVVFSEEILQAMVASDDPRSHRGLILHETFHVFSRLNPEMRKRLYGAIGFRDLESVELSGYLLERRLTNPDGPAFHYGIDVTLPDERTVTVVPVVYSKFVRYQPDKTLFDYLMFELFEVEKDGASWRVSMRDGAPVEHSPEEVGEYFEQIGRNTHYIIHPDEILADNAVLLVAARTHEEKAGDTGPEIKTPEILDAMQEILIRGHGGPSPAAGERSLPPVSCP